MSPEAGETATGVLQAGVSCASFARHYEVNSCSDYKEVVCSKGNINVESTQSMIRILGLSATLPNYLDVASFLHVNPFIGLFYFDSRFRPVPLGQSFVGIKTTNKVQQLHDMEEVCYEKVLKQIRAGHQVMAVCVVEIFSQLEDCSYKL
ncbi:Activating signal cointegrator 1 complex subunit 3 [Labeo rohita]|uniref:Activating signal cointegrator 1 complex subunit 3 n=1 Tax=Labeo rohita TaxID=84645 RepID=A0ABQ8LYK4_LABRO|nr:Activating signal cointegrator 1 complex subunit 3 [Labeo rohita]